MWPNQLFLAKSHPSPAQSTTSLPEYHLLEPSQLHIPMTPAVFVFESLYLYFKYPSKVWTLLITKYIVHPPQPYVQNCIKKVESNGKFLVSLNNHSSNIIPWCSVGCYESGTLEDLKGLFLRLQKNLICPFQNVFVQWKISPSLNSSRDDYFCKGMERHLLVKLCSKVPKHNRIQVQHTEYIYLEYQNTSMSNTTQFWYKYL